MFVRTLIGRNAGTIIEMPYHVAQTAIMNGTAKEVSEQELEDAKLSVVIMATQEPPDSLPSGYTIEPDPLKGFNVLDAGGVVLTNEVLLPNLLAAREWARAHAASQDTQKPKPAAKSGRPVGGSKAAQAEAAAASAEGSEEGNA